MDYEPLITTTSILVGETGCEIDIDSVFTSITPDEDIVKIKCNNKEKTKTIQNECKTFYNQISIIFFDNMNLKIFNNGKLQVSGVKDRVLAETRVKNFLNRISTINGDSEIDVVVNNGLFCYKNKILKPFKDGYICHSLIKDDKIFINSYIYKVFPTIPGTFIQEKHIDKKKNIINCNGESIGNVEYQMIRKNKNLCIKNCTYEINDEKTECAIVNAYSQKIGVLKISIDSEKIYNPINQKVKLYFKCCSSTPELKNFKAANVNSNTKIKLCKGEYIDRNMLFLFLQKNNVFCLYEPSKYPGVKFNLNNSKITIFRTGSVLFSSKTDIKIDDIKSFFKDFSAITINEPELDEIFPETSVWSLME